MKALKVIFSGLLLSTSMNSMAGGSLDLSLSDDTVRVEYDATKANSGLHLSAGIMHDIDDGDLISLGLHVVDVREANSPLYIGVGGKIFGFKGDDVSGGALGVGGFVSYDIPQIPDVGVSGYAYYAPNVVSFGDTENLTDADVRVSYSIIPTARVYLGYCYSAFKIKDVKKTAELDQGFHLGLKVDF